MRRSLLAQAATLAAVQDDVDPKVEEWNLGAAMVDTYAAMPDAELDAALSRPHLDLPSSATAGSEAEARGRPGAQDAAERTAARRAGLAVAHQNAVAEGASPAWQAQMERLVVEAEERRFEMYDRLGTREDGASHEIEGEWGASLAYEEAVVAGRVHNPGAFDAWVDLEMSSGGYPRGSASRSRIKGYRRELARIAEVSYAGTAVFASR